MAWIEAHQQLLNHPKTIDLMNLMGWDLDTTIGKLFRFWWWCVDYAEDGDLRRHNENRIAVAVGLQNKDGKKFIDAMIQAGWIDNEPYFRVHDWWDYIGLFMQRKYGEKHREKWERIKQLYNDYTTTSTTIDATKPNLTKPNLTKKNPPKEAAFSEGFVKKADEAKEKGFNIYQLSNRFYKESKSIEKLPEAVLMAVLDEFLQRGSNVRDCWPYFIKVLENKSAAHYAEKSIKEGEAFKRDRNFAPSIAQILAGMK